MWNHCDQPYSQGSFSGNAPSRESQNSFPRPHGRSQTSANDEASNPEREIPSISSFVELFENVEHPALTENQYENVLGDPETHRDQLDDQDGGTNSSLANQVRGGDIDLFAWLGSYEIFQVEAESLPQIQEMPITVSGTSTGLASGTPERRNISNGNITSEEGVLSTEDRRPVDLGPVPWTHLDDHSLLHWLDDTNGLLLNNVRTEGGSYQSRISSSSSAVDRTPSHNTSSSSDVQQPSMNGCASAEEPQLPPPNGGSVDLDESSVEFGQEARNMHEKLNSRKRRYNSEELEKVNSVRASSACTRCQVMKEACSEDSIPGPCKRCQAIESSSRIWKTPCFRGQLTAAEIFRTISLNFPFGSKKITQWHGKDRRQVELYYPLSNLSEHVYVPYITVKCRKFRPAIGDVVTKSYPTPQGSCILDLPPFTLIETPAVRNTMDQYITNNLDTFVKELKFGVVGKQFSATFDEIMRLSADSTMLLLSLHIACMTRMASRSFGIRGEEDLGIQLETNPHSPYVGRKPVPIMIDREMDLIWRFLMEKKRKLVLAELKRKILGRKRVHWFEIYLTVFTLMTNLEFCYQHQVTKLRRHQAATRPGEVISSAPTLSMLDKWQASAENIIAHFAVVSQGQYPFTLDWSMGENSIAAGMDSISTRYMMDLINTLSTIEWPDFESMDPDIARVQPLYWVSKIFQPPLARKT
ncbi:hypothetical protein V8E51_018639 [Hyaloscypha variabilis]